MKPTRKTKIKLKFEHCNNFYTQYSMGSNEFNLIVLLYNPNLLIYQGCELTQ